MAADVQRDACLASQRLKACASHSGERQIGREKSGWHRCHAELIPIKCVIIYNLTSHPLSIIWPPPGSELERLGNNLWRQQQRSRFPFELEGNCLLIRPYNL